MSQIIHHWFYLPVQQTREIFSNFHKRIYPNRKLLIYRMNLSLVTSVKCSIKSVSSRNFRGLQNHLKYLKEQVRSLPSTDSPSMSLRDESFSFGNNFEINFNIEDCSSFSLRDIFSLNQQIVSPTLKTFSDPNHGLQIASPSDEKIDSISIDVSFGENGENSARMPIRETVIPSSSQLYELFRNQRWKSEKKNPGVYYFSSEDNVCHPPYRVVPGVRPTFILYATDFDSLREQSRRVFKVEDMIGGYVEYSDGSIAREKLLDILDFHQLGISVRFSNHKNVTQFFVHESDSVLENTIQSIQSARVMGGPSSLVENKYGYSGDCWSEVKAMGSNIVGKTLQGQSASVMSTTGTTNKSSLISKEPSIIE